MIGEFNVRLGSHKTQKELSKDDVDSKWIKHFEEGQHGEGSISQNLEELLTPLPEGGACLQLAPQACYHFTSKDSDQCLCEDEGRAS